MKPPRLLNHIAARLQNKMVCIAEHELEVKIFDHVAIDRFEGSIGAYGHKIRRIDNAMRGVNAAHPSAGFAGLMD